MYIIIYIYVFHLDGGIWYLTKARIFLKGLFMIGRSPKTADRSDHEDVTLAQKFYGVLGSRPLGPWIGTNKAGMTTVTAR